MKKNIFGILCVVTTVSCVTQATVVIKGSGKAVKGAFDISLDYTELSVQQGIRVVLVPSETGEGTISADEKIFEHVFIEQEHGRVEVKYRPRITIRLQKVETVVTMPVSKASMTLFKASSAGKIESEMPVKAAETITISGSSAANLNLDVKAKKVMVDMNSAARFGGRVEGDEVDIDLSSSAGLDVTVAAGCLEADLSSAARCSVDGNADRCDVDASSAAGFRGYGLVCKSANIGVSSAGFAEITVTDELNVKASSGGKVRYKGNPRINRDVSSGGSVGSID